jgi:hypothetical protein
MKKSGKRSVLNPPKSGKSVEDATDLTTLEGMRFPYDEESYTEEHVPGAPDTLAARSVQIREERKASSLHHLGRG